MITHNYYVKDKVLELTVLEYGIINYTILDPGGPELNIPSEVDAFFPVLKIVCLVTWPRVG